jgi:hypothetical protein
MVCVLCASVCPRSIGAEGFPLKVFNVADNQLAGPFPGFLYNNLTHIMAQYCLASDKECHLWVSVSGGDNKLTCPTQVDTHSGLLPEDLAHLSRQNMGCVGSNGTLYEISSVLAGKPVALQSVTPEKPVEPTSSGKEIPPGGATPEVKAAARQEALSKASGAAPVDATADSGAAPWWDQARGNLPTGAIIGIAVAVIVGVALVAVLGFVFIYRRWWTVRAARSFQKMQEGPLAAAGGATISSSAPHASLDTLQAPQVPRGDNVV